MHEGAEEWEEEEEYEESQQMFNSGFRSILKGKQGQSINDPVALRDGGGNGEMMRMTRSNVGGMRDNKSMQEAVQKVQAVNRM